MSSLILDMHITIQQHIRFFKYPVFGIGINNFFRKSKKNIE